jgi:hypothetical protein
MSQAAQLIPALAPSQVASQKPRPNEPRTGTLPVCIRCARTRSDASIEANEVDQSRSRWRTQGTGFDYSAGVTGRAISN